MIIMIIIIIVIIIIIIIIKIIIKLANIFMYIRTNIKRPPSGEGTRRRLIEAWITILSA